MINEFNSLFILAKMFLIVLPNFLSIKDNLLHRCGLFPKGYDYRDVSTLK